MVARKAYVEALQEQWRRKRTALRRLEVSESLIRQTELRMELESVEKEYRAKLRGVGHLLF